MVIQMKFLYSPKDKNQGSNEVVESETESFAEVSESDLIALALSPNGDETNDAHKLASLPSDSTLNSVSLTDVDGMYNVRQINVIKYINEFK